MRSARRGVAVFWRATAEEDSRDGKYGAEMDSGSLLLLRSRSRCFSFGFGLYWSKDVPVSLSTYSKSSIESLAALTAIFTPFVLCRWILPCWTPKNSASTLKAPDLSIHVRTRREFGFAKSAAAALSDDDVAELFCAAAAWARRSRNFSSARRNFSLASLSLSCNSRSFCSIRRRCLSSSSRSWLSFARSLSSRSSRSLSLDDFFSLRGLLEFGPNKFLRNPLSLSFFDPDPDPDPKLKPELEPFLLDTSLT